MAWPAAPRSEAARGLRRRPVRRDQHRPRRKGARRVASWIEALHAAVPQSHYWEDFDERLPYLEEAAGMRLDLPEEAERLEVQRVDIGRCREGTEAAVEELVD